MTASDRKRAERRRRKEEGEVRVEMWLSAKDACRLKQMALDADISVSNTVTQLLAYYYS